MNFSFSPQEELTMLRTSNQHYKQENQILQAAVNQLTEQVNCLKQQLYGTKSEQATLISVPIDDDGEKNTPDEPQKPQEQPAPEKAQEKSDQKKTHKRKLMVRTDKVLEHLIIPEEVKQNPNAYRQLPEGMDKCSYRLELVPSHLELHRYRRPCFTPIDERDSQSSKILCAPAPTGILSGSNIGASLMAHVLHSKFCLHLPFYRMIQELERMGLSGLDEATVCNWHKAVADALRPIWKAMHSELLDAEVLHVDETPFRCLRSGKKNGYMWAMSCADSGMNLYYWKDGRSGDVLDALLREDMKPEGTPYGGTIVSDGYDAYESWIKKLEKNERKPIQQNCWAHVRRKFVETARCGNAPEWSLARVKQIAPLYALEQQLRKIDAPPEKIAAERREKSRPLAEAFFEELERKAKDSENPPLNKLRTAIDYALERKSTLMHWLDNPAVPMDNNQVERAIRPLTIGRKNCLFIGAPEAGERSAILYTMVEECKRVGVDPRAWLTEVLRILPTYRASGGYLDLLPGILPIPDLLKTTPRQL